MRTRTATKLGETIVADLFIIPNTASKAANFMSMAETRKNEMEQLCKANGLVFDPEDPLVQIWVTNDDVENFQDHHPRFIMGGKVYEYNLQTRLPYSILKNIKEGETFDITIPVKGRPVDLDEDTKSPVETEINFKLTAKQTEYRYRRFGKFEECLRMVI